MDRSTISKCLEAKISPLHLIEDITHVKGKGLVHKSTHWPKTTPSVLEIVHKTHF